MDICFIYTYIHTADTFGDAELMSSTVAPRWDPALGSFLAVDSERQHCGEYPGKPIHVLSKEYLEVIYIYIERDVEYRHRCR